ncbi:MAG: hypothetical protein JWO46_727 [Nocardioidaceae bacterium]|nr:hypothetical protein [Nocardioidaceae bacterium]
MSDIGLTNDSDDGDTSWDDRRGIDALYGGGTDVDERADDDYYETFSRRDGRRQRGSGGGGGRRRKRGGSRWIPMLVLLVVLVAIVGGGYYGFGKLKDHFAPAADYPGPGSGSVSFEVHKGDSPATMGQGLRKQGVVKSVDAFLDAARKDNRSSTIQVGFYPMKKQMAAKDALAVLVNPKNIEQSGVTITEGARVRDIVKTIVAKTDFTKADLVAALKDPAKLGLPPEAAGNPEGYLYPATYQVKPDTTALSLLQEMVSKTKSVEQELDLVNAAKAKNLSVPEVLTVASILEYEGNRAVDYPKIARVIYNRLNKGMALQLDSTVSYVSGRKGDVWTTAAERDSDSKYNTYKNTGLPPGPIGSPGEETIKAALNPAAGPWLYFVPDFENGTTLFTDSYAQHQKNVEKAKEYCRTHDSC